MFAFFCVHFRTLANRLLKIMEHLQSLVLHKHVWIRLIPFLHMLSGEDNIQHQTDNYNSDSWWGVTELRNLVDRNKGFYSTRYAYKYSYGPINEVYMSKKEPKWGGQSRFIKASNVFSFMLPLCYIEYIFHLVSE